MACTYRMFLDTQEVGRGEMLEGFQNFLTKQVVKIKP